MNLIKANNQSTLIDALSIRGIVFNDEQNVSSQIQIDHEDKTCLHYVCYEDDKPIGAVRLVIHDTYAKLGRFCVLKPFRNKGVGKFMLQELEKQPEVIKIGQIQLGAQLSAYDFYKKCGYIGFGEEYSEANIRHRMMKKAIHGR